MVNPCSLYNYLPQKMLKICHRFHNQIWQKTQNELLLGGFSTHEVGFPKKAILNEKKQKVAPYRIFTPYLEIFELKKGHWSKGQLKGKCWQKNEN